MPRDYKAEYRRRIARGLKRGLTKAQARGHAKPTAQKAKKSVTPKTDKNLNAAILEMNRGKSLAAAARVARVSPERLRTFLRSNKIGKRKGRRWATRDDRPRCVPVMTRGRFRVLTVAGYQQARLVGEHHHAAGEFVRTNDVQLLKPFDGRAVRTIDRKNHPLETDPNALHRIAAMDTPPFHEIYEITSTT